MFLIDLFSKMQVRQSTIQCFCTDPFVCSGKQMCPVCAGKIAKDMVGHISLQHGHLFKMQRRRRFRRAGVPSNATLSLLGKELREAHLQALLGGTSRSSGLSNVTDPVLSSLVYNVPISEAEDPPKPTVVVEEQPTKLSSLSQQSKAR